MVPLCKFDPRGALYARFGSMFFAFDGQCLFVKILYRPERFDYSEYRKEYYQRNKDAIRERRRERARKRREAVC